MLLRMGMHNLAGYLHSFKTVNHTIQLMISFCFVLRAQNINGCMFSIKVKSLQFQLKTYTIQFQQYQGATKS